MGSEYKTLNNIKNRKGHRKGHKDTLWQLADLKSVGISGAPLDFVDFNSFNRIFTIVYIVRNKYYNFTQNMSSTIFSFSAH